jgi:hypothetical protein
MDGSNGWSHDSAVRTTHAYYFFILFRSLSLSLFLKLDYRSDNCRIDPVLCWKLGLCQGYRCQLDFGDHDHDFDDGIPKRRLEQQQQQQQQEVKKEDAFLLEKECMRARAYRSTSTCL